MNFNVQLLLAGGQFIVWLIILVGAHYSLKARVEVNKLELDTLKHQVNQRIKMLEGQYDKVYQAIERLNLRIDDNFKMLIKSIQNQSLC